MEVRKFWTAVAIGTLAVWAAVECSREDAGKSGHSVSKNLAASGMSATLDELLNNRYGFGERLCVIANTSIDESSGLAHSSRPGGEGVFWTHNDSGDGPRIYAFNKAGKDLGSIRVIGAAAQDWEDMASYRIGERSYLLLADVGDNGRRRKNYSLYVVAEPDVSAIDTDKPADRDVKLWASMNFVYEDGPHDCEAVAVDPAGGKIYLFIKAPAGEAKMYVLPLPKLASTELRKASAVAKIPIAFATAMDISPDGERAVILTYGCSFEFGREKNETWEAAFSRKPRVIFAPLRRQGESICYGPDSRTLYLTSEQLPTPLWEVSPERSVAHSGR